MARRHKWNSLTNERGNDVDIELVDLARVEERGDQPAATHHPDVFSRCGAQTLHKRFHRLVHKLRSWYRPLRWFPGEHVIGVLRVEHPALHLLFSVIVETPIVGLAPPQNGVDGGIELAHAVVGGGRQAIEPFERTGGNAEGPYQVQYDLQDMMQTLVGIVRREEEMVRALDGIQKLQQRAQQVAVHGHREYNPGWHTALDLKNLLTVSEAITRSAIERKESRGGHFREDFQGKDAGFGKVNVVLKKNSDGTMNVRRETIPDMPAELKQIIEEMK